MKKFNFKYSSLLWTMLILVLCLSGAGAGWNVYNAVYFMPISGLQGGLYILISLLSFAVFVLAISMMVYGCYTVKDGYLISNFGLIKSKSKISDVIEITHFKKSDKLVIYFKEGAFSVIMIAPKNYDDFVLSLREVNPEISFDNRIDGEDTPGN